MEKIDPLLTLLEIIGHSINRHPDLAPHVQKLAKKKLGENEHLDISEWTARAYGPPSPHFIKQAVLLRNNLSNSTWIETGTFLGDTAEFLSQHATFLHTIEPEPKLYEKAKQRLSVYANVMVHNDISEISLQRLLPSLSGNVCLWLDGHYSGGDTFAGPNDTPLREELRLLSENMKRYENVSILIDDIRLCGRNHVYGSYPSLNELVDFANKCDLTWYIEHDIFIAKSKNL
jgi:hypothetical protein